MFFINDISNFERTRVKTYTRKGKLVRSYDREGKKKQINAGLIGAGIGAATVLGLSGAYLLGRGKGMSAAKKFMGDVDEIVARKVKANTPSTINVKVDMPNTPNQIVATPAPNIANTTNETIAKAKEEAKQLVEDLTPPVKVRKPRTTTAKKTTTTRKKKVVEEPIVQQETLAPKKPKNLGKRKKKNWNIDNFDPGKLSDSQLEKAIQRVGNKWGELENLKASGKLTKAELSDLDDLIDRYYNVNAKLSNERFNRRLSKDKDLFKADAVTQKNIEDQVKAYQEMQERIARGESYDYVPEPPSYGGGIYEDFCFMGDLIYV